MGNQLDDSLASLLSKIDTHQSLPINETDFQQQQKKASNRFAESMVMGFSIRLDQLTPVNDGADHTAPKGSHCILHPPIYEKPSAEGKIQFRHETNCTDSGTGLGNHSKTAQYESPAFAITHSGKGTGNFEYNFTWKVDSISIVLGGDEGLAPPFYPWHGTASGAVVLFLRVYKAVNGSWTLFSRKNVPIVSNAFSFNKLDQRPTAIRNKTIGIGLGFFANNDETFRVLTGMHALRQLDLDGCTGFSRITINARLISAEWSPVLG